MIIINIQFCTTYRLAKHPSISYQTALSASIRRLPAHLASALTNHPGEIQAL